MMENSIILQILTWVLLLALIQAHIPNKKHYIVYLGSNYNGRNNARNLTSSHQDMISNLSNKNGNDSSKKLIYSYTKIFNAFAASLDEEEAEELAKHPSVISIFESRIVEQQTTRSWDFLSSFQRHDVLTQNSVWEKANFGEDIIIGGLDTGVWPESRSFSDEGYGSIPKKFQGICANEIDQTFKCNRKLIGARYFYKGRAEMQELMNETLSLKPTARDMGGHGTHTLSIAGGNVVSNVDAVCVRLLNIKNATVKGGSPRARVVSYKVSWPEAGGGASQVDILAGFEAAISDGVDVINLSLGTPYTPEDFSRIGEIYVEDATSLASFHAMANGILVVAAAGNSGPSLSSVANFAPWILTVGASTMDRGFTCDIILGNRQKIRAARYMDADLNNSTNSFFPLITGVDAHIIGANLTNASYCTPGTLDPVKVKGKILVCLMEPTHIPLYVPKSIEAKKVGAVGLILANDQSLGPKLQPDLVQGLPTAHINYNDGQAVFTYVNSTRIPTALITSTRTELGIKPAPTVAEFSSRGPNPVTPEILKPDVVAPGVNIIAAYSQAPNVKMSDTYVPYSGTSMASPHVAGIAALLRKIYPHWTTSAIKSAIISTARPLDNREMPMLEDDIVHQSTPFAFGAGLIQPNLAMDPGLVYDMNHYDYLNFLCAYHLNSTSILKFSKHHAYRCPKSFNLLDFNYPSITIPELSSTAIATRRLKNVGQPGTYTARIEAPPHISIVVEPKTLVFSKQDQEINFKLIFSKDVSHHPMDTAFGSLVWSDGKHVVRSPIVVMGKGRVAT